MRTVFDHLVVAAARLDEGAAWVRERLGVEMNPGGRHPRMGTHNRLLRVGPGRYMEVIAVDPDAPAPDRLHGSDRNAAGAPPVGERRRAWRFTRMSLQAL